MTTGPAAEQVCGCNRCDDCYERNPGYDPPWGWDRGTWDDYVVSSIVDTLQRGAGLGSSHVESQAWCVLVILLSTAAMALLHDAPAAEGPTP